MKKKKLTRNTMEKDTQNTVIDNVKNLISYSIENRFSDSKFEQLHRAILKIYFEAKNISINYDDKTIDLQIPISSNNFTTITFECMDLNGFLQACLKSDQSSMSNYQNLLAQYGVVNAA